MRCRTVRRKLPAYQDGDLPAPEREELEAHLRECEACAREYAELRSVVGIVESLEPARAPSALTRRVLAEIAASPEVATEPAPSGWPIGAVLGFAGLVLTGLIIAGALSVGRGGVAEWTVALGAAVGPVADAALLAVDVLAVIGNALALALAKPFVWLMAADITALVVVLALRRRLEAIRVPRRHGSLLISF